MHAMQTLAGKAKLIVSTVLAVLLAQGFFVQYHVTTIENGIHQEMELVQPTVQKLNDLTLNIVHVQQWLTDISATRGLDGRSINANPPCANAV